MGKKHIPVIYLFVILTSALSGCAGLPDRVTPSPEECIQRTEEFLRTAPDKKYLVTLDDQQVPLAEFFALCKLKSPYCALYSKFYWWKNEIREIVSETESGPVRHKVRIYYNLMSACNPESIHPLCTHGDVAEFYDASGQFMGLAVYMGQGLYCPLPYSGYEGNVLLHHFLST
jgi:hypothetical protein